MAVKDEAMRQKYIPTMKNLSSASCVSTMVDELMAPFVEGSLTFSAVEDLVNRIVEAACSPDGLPESALDDAILFLCKLATHSDAETQRLGVLGLFPLFVERLSDSFNPNYCRLYDRTFALAIDFCRKHPAGQKIHQALKHFNLHTKEDILTYKASLRMPQPIEPSHLKQLKKCVVLSRVTLGSDIAVTSIVIKKLLAVCPNAEIVLVGDQKLTEIFYDIPQFYIRHYRYPSQGSLITRLEGWLEVLEIIHSETRHLPHTEYMVVDPDSRLTQLGLLPVSSDHARYRFFESRTFQHADQQKISLLTASWLTLHFGGESIQPFLRLAPTAQRYAQTVRQRLLGAGETLTSVAYGVGGNEKKRVGFDFELALLKNLLKLQGNRLLLFKGVTADEKLRTTALLHELATTAPLHIVELAGNEINAVPFPLAADIVAWEGALGEYCALIAESDMHVGYDSSNQHIAAAFGVPTIDIFADHSTPMVIERWTPHGMRPVYVVRAFEQSENESTIKNIIGQVNAILAHHIH